MNPEDKLRAAIEETRLAEVLQAVSNLDGVEETPDVKKVIVQSRIEHKEVSKWLSLINFLLREEEEQDSSEDKWSIHCCKTYLRSEGRLGFVWSMAISTRGDIKRAVNDVSRAIRMLSAGLQAMPALGNSVNKNNKPKNVVQRAARAVASGRAFVYDPVVTMTGDRAEVWEMPLTGLTENRNKPKSEGGKGAKMISGVF